MSTKKKNRQGETLPIGPMALLDAPDGFVFRGVRERPDLEGWFLVAMRLGQGKNAVFYCYHVIGDPLVVGWRADHRRPQIKLAASSIIEGDRAWPVRATIAANDIERDPLRPSLPFTDADDSKSLV